MLLNPCPFLTIDFKLTIESATIQSTNNGQKKVPAILFSFDNLFYSDVRRNIEEKICFNFCYTATLNYEKITVCN